MGRAFLRSFGSSLLVLAATGCGPAVSLEASVVGDPPGLHLIMRNHGAVPVSTNLCWVSLQVLSSSGWGTAGSPWPENTVCTAELRGVGAFGTLESEGTLRADPPDGVSFRVEGSIEGVGGDRVTITSNEFSRP